ncbi:13780_t:CDS:2, partial [Funneliformis caledonium]
QTEQELTETVEQASNELDKGDNQITQLRTQLNQLKTSKEKLERELNLARIKRNSPSIANTVYNDNFDTKNQVQQQVSPRLNKAKETASKPLDYYRKQEAFYRGLFWIGVGCLVPTNQDLEAFKAWLENIER